MCLKGGWIMSGKESVAGGNGSLDTRSEGVSLAGSLLTPSPGCHEVRWSLPPNPFTPLAHFFCLELANNARTETSKTGTQINLSSYKLWAPGILSQRWGKWLGSSITFHLLWGRALVCLSIMAEFVPSWCLVDVKANRNVCFVHSEKKTLIGLKLAQPIPTPKWLIRKQSFLIYRGQKGSRNEVGISILESVSSSRKRRIGWSYITF